MNKRIRTFLFCLFCLLAAPEVFAQQVNVTGKVTDVTNDGVPGVSVKVKGTKTGVVTDMNGNYSITIDGSKKNTFVFSFIGYLTQEVSVGNKTVINVVLQDDSQSVDEVVVVAYGTARKGDLTGALTTMRPNANDAAKTNSIDGLLSGKIAGMVVNSSSNVGGAASITIRGASSLRGDNQPLYVIDNIPQASTGEFSSSAISGDFQVNQDPLSSINPSDIEDITILKDASSTAIYGSRGANGVILITTKKGKEGKLKVNASATYTIAKASRLLDMIDLHDYANYINSRISSNDVPYHFVGDEVRYTFNGEYDKYDPNDPETYNVLTYRNWQKEIYHTAFSQNYSLSLNGGTGKTTYFASANFRDINGTVKQTGLKQGDLRLNLNTQLSKTVTLNMALNGSLRSNDMMAGGNTLGGATGAISRTALDYAPFELPDNDPSFSNETKTTIFSWLNDYVDKTTDRTFKASVELNWNILKNLRYSLRTGGNLNTNERKRWYGLQLYQGMNFQGLLNVSNLDKSNYSVENIINYNTQINEFIKMDATAGVTYEDYNYLFKNTKGTNFTNFDFRENGLHMAGSVENATPIQKDYQLLSYLGRVNFNFMDKYLLTASLRADGSSKFSEKNRWGYFPSASIAWRLEQEQFMKDVNWLNQLKLRLSYGVTGNQSIDPYSTFSMYGNLNNIYADGSGTPETSMNVTNLSNNSLKWEKTSSWNLGVDFSLFKSRLSGTVDIYNKKTTDLLISRTLPGSSGFASTYYNQGSLTNKGVEITLNAHIINANDWQWNISGNIGFNKGKIGDLGLLPAKFGCLGERVGYYGNSLGDHFGVAHIFLAGEAPGLFYGYSTQGIIQKDDVQSDGSIRYIKKDGSYGYYKTFGGNPQSAGDVKFVDVDEDGVVDTNDRDIIGDPNPDFTYGFQTSVSWKKLTLSATFAGVKGRDILNTNNRYSATPGIRSGNLLSEAYRNMWTDENPSNLYPKSTFSVGNYVMDRYVEDGSYLRCSDITLGYVLPSSWMKAIGFINANVYASVKNAFLITDYNGYDPEVNSFAFDGLRPGVDMNSYPNPRSFIFGLNLTF